MDVRCYGHGYQRICWWPGLPQGEHSRHKSGHQWCQSADQWFLNLRLLCHYHEPGHCQEGSSTTTLLTLEYISSISCPVFNCALLDSCSIFNNKTDRYSVFMSAGKCHWRRWIQCSMLKDLLFNICIYAMSYIHKGQNSCSYSSYCLCSLCRFVSWSDCLNFAQWQHCKNTLSVFTINSCDHTWIECHRSLE